jgi:protein tyrosine phosphatase (PTP) superfamily phosphohydrolase (DUF442 family)
MSENTKKTQITINDVEYMYEDLAENQKALFSHCVDLDRKIGSAQFNLDQLQVGKKAFIDMLEQSLKAEPEVEVLPAEAVVQ